MGVQVNLKDIASGFLSAAAHTANNTLIESALDNALDRTGTVNNAMETEFDLGNYRGINAADGIYNSDLATVKQLNLASGAGTGIIVQGREVMKGSDAVGQLFTLSSVVYVPGTNNLEIDRNGNTAINGFDYIETSENEVEWIGSFNPSDDFVFKTNTSVTNTTSNTAAITHIENGVINNLATFLQDSYVVNVKHFGAVGDGAADDTAAVQAAITAASGGVVYAPEGTYRVSEVTETVANIVGAGAGNTTFLLGTGGTESLFIINSLSIESCTLDDNARASIDKTSGSTAAAYLCETDTVFKLSGVELLTDRSVVLQNGAMTSDQLVVVEDCSLTRKTAPVANETDAMNLFTLSNTQRIFFDKVTVSDVICRSVINGSYTQTSSHTHEKATAVVTNCSFENARLVDVAEEFKALFFQGYATIVNNNIFTDCFGRCIDVLSNYNSVSTGPSVGDPFGNIYRSHVTNNTISFTTARQNDLGSAFNEPGCIYCRYGDVVIEGNHLDFTELLLTSTVYSAIVVRHGYKSCVIKNNTIIGPKANGILADISHAITTDECAVWIHDNIILNAIEAARTPIKVANNDATNGKIIDYVSIQNNACEYISSTFIEIEQAPTVSVAFGFKAMVINGNFNKTFEAWDDINFKNFPEYLDAPKADVVVSVDPNGLNKLGVLTDPVQALDTMTKFNCRSLTIQVDPAATADITITGPEAYLPKSRSTIIDGKNAGGFRFKFVSVQADTTNISFTLDNNILLLDDIRVESEDNVATDTVLVRLSGTGDCAVKDGEYQWAKIGFDTRGPNLSIKDSVTNDIDKGGVGAIVFSLNTGTSTPKITVDGISGANVTELYNFDSPVVFTHQGTSVGTTAGTKTYTVVV